MQKSIVMRVCATCGDPLPFKPDGTQEGYICCDEYYCTKTCLDASFQEGETWNEHYSDDDECCFTEWPMEEAE